MQKSNQFYIVPFSAVKSKGFFQPRTQIPFRSNVISGRIYCLFLSNWFSISATRWIRNVICELNAVRPVFGGLIESNLF